MILVWENVYRWYFKIIQLWSSKTKNKLGTVFMYQPLIPSPFALPSFYSCLNVDHNGAVISTVYLISSILYLMFWSFLCFVFIWSGRHWLCSELGVDLLSFRSSYRILGLLGQILGPDLYLGETHLQQ